jgi:hypothetical protein
MFQIQIQRAPNWHCAAIVGTEYPTVADAALVAREQINSSKFDDLRVGIVNLDTKETVATV